MELKKGFDPFQALYSEPSPGPSQIILTTYKTTKCPKLDCPFQIRPDQGAVASETGSIFQCTYYHSADDQRRPLFVFKGNLNYDSTYFEDITELSEQAKNSISHCLNGFEYLYHPMNYKTSACPALTDCPAQTFCPNYHNDDELKLATFRRTNLEKELSTAKVHADGALAHLTNAQSLDPQSTKEADAPPPDLQIHLTSRSDRHLPFILSDSTANRYYSKRQVKVFEDIWHEFKEMKKLDLYLILRYICGFLNSKGGVLAIGISDKGCVNGVSISLHELVAFYQKMEEALKDFHPQVTRANFHMQVSRVYKAENNVALQDRFIVEIIVACDPFNHEIYFTDSGECWIKRAASLNLVKPSHLKELLKSKLIKTMKEKLSLFNGSFDGFNDGELTIGRQAIESNLAILKKKLQP